VQEPGIRTRLGARRARTGHGEARVPTRPEGPDEPSGCGSTVGPEPNRGGRSLFLHCGPHVLEHCWLVSGEPGDLGLGPMSIGGAQPLPAPLFSDRLAMSGSRRSRGVRSSAGLSPELSRRRGGLRFFELLGGQARLTS